MDLRNSAPPSLQNQQSLLALKAILSLRGSVDLWPT